MEKELNVTEYSTGNVTVPRKRRGILPIVLLCLIFVLCLVSSFDFLYGALFDSQEEDTVIVFAKDVRFAPTEQAEGYADIDSLGIHGRMLTEFDRQYFDLPKGVYITTASPRVPNLQVGDVLMRINGTEVTDQEALGQMLSAYAPGTTLELEIYRNGKTQVITTTL